MHNAGFLKNEGGNVALLFGLGFVVLMVTSGAAIDYSRWHHVQSQTQLALDSAVLAAGRSLQLHGDFATAKSVGTAFFNARVSGRLPVIDHGVDFTNEDGGAAVQGTATGKVETPLLGLAHVPELPLTVTSKAAFSVGGAGAGSDLEIALMLDVTGSMCNDGEGPCTTSTKLAALKTSAKNLIDVVIKDLPGSQTTRVALVPFSTRVRVGANGTAQTANRMKDLTDLDRYWSGWYNVCEDSTGGGESEGSGDWVCNDYDPQEVADWEIMPCVTDRTGVAQYTDAAPGSNTWLNAHGGSRFPKSWDSTDTPIPAGDHLGLTESDYAEHWNYVAEDDDNDVYCSDVAEANEILPLTDDKSDLKDRIDGLEAYGATAGALGTAWSWYMMSPDWSGIWNGNSTPGPYSDLTTMVGGVPKLRKIAILMTDGQYNTLRGWKDSDPVTVSNDAKSLCTNMKAAGIEIFTVGFDLDSLPAADKARAIDTLQSCGSDIDHFYNTLDTSELQQAFNAIALSLSQLYLAK